MSNKKQGKELVVRTLILPNGSSPFEDWFDSLRDVLLQRAVDARIARIRDGNFGDHKGVGKGVFELRIHKGPGLRVYYGIKGRTVVILLGGGDKNSQSQAIRRAQELWKEYSK